MKITIQKTPFTKIEWNLKEKIQKWAMYEIKKDNTKYEDYYVQILCDWEEEDLMLFGMFKFFDEGIKSITYKQLDQIVLRLDKLEAKRKDSKTETYKPKKVKTFIMKDNHNNLYKIGKPINPKFREKTLQSEKPSIDLIKIFNENIESKLHEQFKTKRVRGEWFKLSKEDIKTIIKTNPNENNNR